MILDLLLIQSVYIELVTILFSHNPDTMISLNLNLFSINLNLLMF